MAIYKYKPPPKETDLLFCKFCLSKPTDLVFHEYDFDGIMRAMNEVFKKFGLETVSALMELEDHEKDTEV